MFFKRRAKLSRITRLQVFGKDITVSSMEFVAAVLDRNALANFIMGDILESKEGVEIIKTLKVTPGDHYAAVAVIDDATHYLLTVDELRAAMEHLEAQMPEIQRICDKLDLIGPQATAQDLARLMMEEMNRSESRP